MKVSIALLEGADGGAVVTWSGEDAGYRLLSYDGGRSFNVLDGEGRIIGPAEEVCPHDSGLQKLVKIVSKKGRPLDPASSDDMDMLARAGFEVITGR